ncbi:DUF554 domain-containing protein [Deferribacterales bacterium Es71-Z0220]|uniref:DUF554 domain-containing protein n=1 Tax=Deferrivibrio essentukiensis TaxID=2880922 RepID=UPI001F61462C|nr:DUF554 domain-containing protein [Deferrivibrio essentukiensis]MCB4204984.1 DUF554 domain-containing protein [Deferrivibrio essentukiensis]
MVLGTIVNAAAVTVGTVIGLFFGKRIKGELKESVLKALGLAVIVLGAKMAFEEHDFLAALISLVVGTIIGEIIDIEDKLDKVGSYIQNKTRSTSNTFVLGFVTASVLFCVGSMTIIGAIKDGLNNDPSVLYVKSMLDGVSSVILTSTLGIGVLFSAIVILIYQGGLSLLASSAVFLLENEIYVNGISVVGGIIIVGIGLNMLNIVKIKTANMLPALFIIPLYDFIKITYF